VTDRQTDRLTDRRTDRHPHRFMIWPHIVGHIIIGAWWNAVPTSFDPASTHKSHTNQQLIRPLCHTVSNDSRKFTFSFCKSRFMQFCHEWPLQPRSNYHSETILSAGSALGTYYRSSLLGDAVNLIRSLRNSMLFQI